MDEEEQIEEDLGIRIGSKREAFLREVLEATEKQIEELKKALDVQYIVLRATKEEIEFEKERFKSDGE